MNKHGHLSIQKIAKKKKKEKKNKKNTIKKKINSCFFINIKSLL